MAYGEIKVDSITFTANGSDATVSVSGLVQNPTFSGDITVTGTISGDIVQGGTLVSGATVSGTAGEFGTITGNTAGFTTVTGTTVTGTTVNAVSGVFTTQVSGATVTGNTGQFTNITGGAAGFTSVTGTTVTGTTANFTSGVFTTQISGTTITGNAGQFSTLTGGTAGFTTITGTTVTGTTANFVTVSGTTVTGGNGNFTAVTTTTANVTSGVFASGTAAAPSVSVGTTDNGLYSPGTDQVAISTNGTGRLFVDANGNVGVGTAPSAKFDIGGQIRFVNVSATDNTVYTNADTATLRFFGGSAASVGNGAALTLQGKDSAAGNYADLAAATGGHIQFRTGTSERLRITSDGKVGVGTTSPATKLHIADSGAPEFRIVDTTNNCTGFIRPVDSSVRFGTGSNHPLEFHINSSERMRIDSSGRVGIGTSSPSALLHVSSTGAVESLLSGGGTSGDTVLHLKGNGNAYKLIVPNAASQYGMGLYDVGNAAYRLYVNGSGNVGIGTTSPDETLEIANSAAPIDGNTTIGQVERIGRLKFGTKNTFGNRGPTASIDHVIRTDTWDFQVFSSQIAFSTAQNTAGALTQRAVITNQGYFGVGTTTPSAGIHVNAPASNSPAIFEINTSEAARIDSSGRALIGTSSATEGRLVLQQSSNTDNGGFALFDAAKGSTFRIWRDGAGTDSVVHFDDRGTTNIALKNGNVGIGTTSPSNALNVIGTVDIDSPTVGSDFTRLRIDPGTTSTDTVTLEARLVVGNSNLAFKTGPAGSTAERARIDSSGRLLVGTSTARSNLFTSVSPQSQVEGTDVSTSSLGLTCNNTNVGGTPVLAFCKSAGSSVGSNTLVANDHKLGQIDFLGSDGSYFTSGARINAEVDGTPGANDMPGRLVFSTTADGASSPTEQLRITSDRYVRLASGTGGIQFNGDTAAANALDDYEEGTWTPVVTSASHKTGRYTKIGNKIHLQCTIAAYAGTTFTVSTIGGLPFTIGSSVYPVPVGVYTVVNGNAGGVGPNNFVESGNLYINNTKNTLVIETSINRTASGVGGGEVLCIGFTYLI